MNAARREGEAEGLKKGWAEGIQKIIHIQSCERILNRQETPMEQLARLPLEELARLAEEMQAEVLKQSSAN